MFVYQAFEAFKLWHRVEPDINNDTLEMLIMIRIGIFRKYRFREKLCC